MVVINMIARKAVFKKWSFPKKENNNLWYMHFKYYLYAVGTADLKGLLKNLDIQPSFSYSLIA